MRIEQYYYNKKVYDIQYLTDSEFWEVINTPQSKDKYSWLRRKLTRGLTRKTVGEYGVVHYDIYIKDSAKIGREKLILHEIGHVLRKKHTWFPTLMNPTWLFRWFKRM